MEWHHIKVGKGENQKCMFGEAVDNYIFYPIAQVKRLDSGQWEWAVFEDIINNSGIEPSRFLAINAANKVIDLIKERAAQTAAGSPSTLTPTKDGR